MDRKELKNKYKQTLHPMGVYQIKNISNGKIFIGNSKNLQAAFNSNMFQLKMGMHSSKELQRDFTTLGEDKFSFEVLDILEHKKEINCDYTDDLVVLEEVWIEKLQPYDDKGYHTRKK